LLNLPISERVSGVDMVQRLCELAAEHGRAVFLLGAEEGVPEETFRALEAMGYTLGKGSGSRPVVMLIKPSEGVVQLGAREVHSGCKAF
jgi:hypothetical protein